MIIVIFVLVILIILAVFFSLTEGEETQEAANTLAGVEMTSSETKAQEETKADEPDTVAEAQTMGEQETLPSGVLMYVSLEEYGTVLRCYDAEGIETSQLSQRDQVECISDDGEWARILYDGADETVYVESRYLSYEDPGRLTIPVISPNIPADETGTVSVHVSKSRRELELLNDGEVIATYSIGLGGWPYDPKETSGDGRTPEGTYYICTQNANSRFYLSLGLSYPNKDDARKGYENGIITRSQLDAVNSAIDAGEQPNWYTALGGEIMIHGCSEDGIGAEYDWTAGCIAVDNEVMDILWEYCPLGTEVIIDPYKEQ